MISIKKTLTVLRSYGLTVFFLLLTPPSLHSQGISYEIGIHGSAGMSALRFAPASGGMPSFGMGYVLGWDVSLLFSERLSFRTGANVTSYRALASFDQMETRNVLSPPPDNLPLDSRFYVVAQYNRYEEEHEVLYIRIPIMIQYMIPAGNNSHFYAAAGVLTGLPINAFYRIRSGDIFASSMLRNPRPAVLS